jgi:hypothetical protein
MAYNNFYDGLREHISKVRGAIVGSPVVEGRTSLVEYRSVYIGSGDTTESTNEEEDS